MSICASEHMGGKSGCSGATTTYVAPNRVSGRVVKTSRRSLGPTVDPSPPAAPPGTPSSVTVNLDYHHSLMWLQPHEGVLFRTQEEQVEAKVGKGGPSTAGTGQEEESAPVLIT